MSQPLDAQVQDNYRNLTFSMLDANTDGCLEYSSEGFDVYCRFFNEIEMQLNPNNGELSHIAEWAGKLHGQMTRLAGLIHCINSFERGENPIDTRIDAIEANAAVEIARFFLAHALAIYMEQSEPIALSNARYLWGRLNNCESICKRDLIRRTQGKKNFNLDESIDVLIGRGYIRTERMQTGTAGRPSETIVINPDAANMMTKLTKLPSSLIENEKVNKVTMPPEFTSNDFNLVITSEPTPFH